MLAAIEDVRARINETEAQASTGFYTDSDLINWVNEGCRDIARRAECLWEFSTQPVSSNVQVYPAPNNIIRIHKIEFSPTNSVLTYPVSPSNILNMDQVWGIQQNIPSSYPSLFSLWGNPPNLNIKLFPVPGESGILNIFYFRLPAIATISDYLDIPEGWQDCVVLYCEYIAKRKDGDPLWKDVKMDYEQKLQDLIASTSEYHDQANFIFTGGGMVPDFIWQGDSF